MPVSARYHLARDTYEAAALRRDGFGWGHDGVGLMLAVSRRPGTMAALWIKWKRRLKMPKLEHVNITVADPQRTAALLVDLFDWRIRWEGAAMGGAGYTVHVGSDDSYVALYAAKGDQAVPDQAASYRTRGGMNHIGITVDNIDKVEEKVKARGLVCHSHADYEPGRRFYFHDNDGVGFEVVSYA